ncbi:unnamed protein product, partial [marine sediment metagenome]
QIANLEKQDLTKEQIDAVNNYNKVVNQVIQSPEYKELSKPRRTALGIVATYGTEKEKLYVTALIKGGQILPYFTPPGRLLLGADTAAEGVKAFETAETPTEKWLAGGTAALGTAIAYSGFKSSFFPSTTIRAPTSMPDLYLKKGLGLTAGTGLATGLGYMEYRSTLAETGDPQVAMGAGIGTGGAIFAGTVGRSLISNFGIERVVPKDEAPRTLYRGVSVKGRPIVGYEDKKIILGKSVLRDSP